MGQNDIENAFGPLFQTSLPDHDKYPMNRGGRDVVWNLVKEDIADSRRYLMITGYTSLEYLVEKLGGSLDARECIEIVLGNEPVPPQNISTHFPALTDRKSHGLPDEIRTYWLERGISVMLNKPVLMLIEKIRFGKVSFFYRSKTHAKVYKGDHHVMLGSSNFTRPGMQTQGEANVRKPWGEESHSEISDIADHFRETATNWNDSIISLLEQLLKNVSWQEALARAVALINEGKWVENYPGAWLRNRAANLWPTQKKSIAQALYLLERQGSVLMADPTGSGKTRMGARLLEALLHRLWVQSAQYRANYQIICPPLVIDTWKRELGYLPQSMAEPVSHGMLSNPNNHKSREVIRNIRNAHILLVDEAHNYLNKASVRSRSIVINRADHVILFTATPLNRRSEDLLRLVEILGLDNLSDDAYKTYQDLLSSREAKSPEKMKALRDYVHRFMVRRTKKELNEAIVREPDAYRDELGNKCRYPANIPKTYKTEETEADIALAERIEKLIGGLKGILYLSNLKADAYDRFSEEREQAFLKKRLHMGPALTRYNIRNMLRSSRAALVEHLRGTEAVISRFGIRPYKENETGNIIGRIQSLHKSKPATNLRISLPEWMRHTEQWQKACDQEIAILEEIASLAEQMSDRRETGKAGMVAKRIESDGMILAYDTALVTLHVIYQKLCEMGFREQAMVVTGSTGNTKKLLKKTFALQAENVRMAALCSDALAEGVNLQRASSVIFLDMPTVIRVAEQRIGRVDRMDSPHKQIAIYWPDDSHAFRLKTDRNFYHRHQLVEDLIGSNISLPDRIGDHIDSFSEESLSTRQIISEFEEHQKVEKSWEGFEDAFSSLRNLVFGDRPIIDPGLYESVIKSSERGGAWTSIVGSKQPFLFAAVQGSVGSAPYWVLRKGNGEHQKDINKIVQELRRLLPDSVTMDPTDETDKLVRDHMRWLSAHEIEMLPNKKKNAIDQMRFLLPRWLKMEDVPDSEWRNHVKKLNDLVFHPGGPQSQGTGDAVSLPEGVDWYELANRWLDVVQPKLIHWIESERKNRKYQNIRLKNINGYLKKNPLQTDELQHILAGLPVLDPVDKRVISMIMGVV
ncbi:MAG: SNF2-related protein [Cyclonatronaceae bacterium]